MMGATLPRLGRPGADEFPTEGSGTIMTQPIEHDSQRDDLDTQLAAMDLANPEFRARVAASKRAQDADMRRTGLIPSVEEYRACYENLARRYGIDVPSDEEIRRAHLVAS